MTNFGARLAEERKRLGLNQEDFGALGGVTKYSQLAYEKGSRRPDSAYLEALVARGVDIAYLFTGVRSSSVECIAVAAGPRVSSRKLASGGPRWQTVQGPLLALCSDSKLDESELFSAALASKANAIRWVGKEIGARVDFAVVPGVQGKWHGASLVFQHTPYLITIEKFKELMFECGSTADSIRHRLWRWFFREENAFSLNTTYVFELQRNGLKEKRLARIAGVSLHEKTGQAYLEGNWESSGELTQFSIAEIAGTMMHLGSGFEIEPKDFVERLSSGHAESITRELTFEQAALLDNYEHADEEGRAAARRVLSSLAQSTAARRAA